MFYYNYKPGEKDYNECISKGICSVSPTISALQEIMFVMLCELSFYVTKLKLMGAENKQIQLEIAHNITYLATLQEYTESQVLEIMNKLFSNLVHTKEIYTRIAKEKGLEHEKISSTVDFENNMEINKLIAEGEKAFRSKYKNFSPVVQNYAEILFSVLKNLTSLIIDLNEVDSLDE